MNGDGKGELPTVHPPVRSRDLDFCEPDPTELTGQPGPWVTAGFDGECPHGDDITEGDTIRATGDGYWEHRECAQESESGEPYGFWEPGGSEPSGPGAGENGVE